jgi:hypothetical protein
MVDGFDETRRLADGALHALLEQGRPEERVWAAWQIALRVGGAMPHIVEHVSGEPSAGVRRALLVILAGHGEYDVLVALARRDPALEVRAQAMQMVTGLAAQGAIAAVVVTDAYAVGPTAIRCAILRGMPATTPDPLREMVLEGMRRGEPEVQLEAFDAALRDDISDQRRAAIRWLGRAPAAVVDEAWQRVQVFPQLQIIAELRRVNVTIQTQALVRLTRFPIAVVGELARDARACQIRRGREDFRTAPIELCARAIVAGCAVGFVELLTRQLVELEAAPLALAPVLADLLAHLETRLAEVAQGRLLADERPAYRWPVKLHYGKLLRQLERLGQPRRS